MGAAKSNPVAITSKGAGRFEAAYQADAEKDLCLHHAVAFERVTGWPVHGTFVGDEPIRFHNEDGSIWCFDVRGMMPALQYGDRVTQPIVLSRRWPRSAATPAGNLEIGCTCLGEEGLSDRGFLLDEQLIELSEGVIRANGVYLDLVPIRGAPRFSAAALSRYSFGQCAVFAEALAKVRGLPAVAMLHQSIADGVHLRPDAMGHCAVLHPDGELEDVWGKVPAPQMAARYGMTSWCLSEEAHREMIQEGIVCRPAVKAEIEEAELLIWSHLDTRSGG